MRKSNLFRFLLVLVVAISLVITATFHFPTGAFAANYTVNDSGDAGDANPGDGICATASSKCTLRAALEESNAHTGADNITIPAMTIHLQKELWITYRLGYDKPVTINGAGQGQTIIDGNNITRVFLIESRQSKHTISNLTIRNGRNTNAQANIYRPGFGGGIFADAHLDLNNVTITNNTALEGGGLYVEFGFAPPTPFHPIVNLNNVTITNNQATTTRFGFGGGGITNGAELNGYNVTVTGNTAALQGGGVYINSWHPISLTNFNISNNISKDGGGLSSDLGNVQLTDGVIDGNRSQCCRLDGSYPGAAGVYNNDGTMVITRVVISNNIAEAAGGLAGGIYNWKYMQLNEVSLIGNRAAYGAAIYNGSYEGSPNQLIMRNVTLSGNIGVNTPPINSEGGALFNNHGVVLMYNSTITNNSAEVAGGISNRNDLSGVVSLYNTILAGNTGNWGATDCRGNITSGHNNLVGNPNGGQYYPCQFNGQHSSDITGVSPNILPLTGWPAHHPLSSNSPAVNSGGNTTCTAYDVRAILRPQGPHCDMGAYERINTNAVIFLPLLRN